MEQETQKQQMEKVIKLAEQTLGTIKEKRPARKFKWWGTGEPLNEEEIRDWNSNCISLERNIARSIEFLNERGEYDAETISQLRCTFHQSIGLKERYCERRHY